MNKKGLSPGKIFFCLGLMLGAGCFLHESAAAMAPVDSVGMQVVKGKRFVVHQVKAKETFFVLSRKYQVPAKSIMAANPQAKAGLKAGDLVYIPRAAGGGKPKTAKVAFKIDNKGRKVHTVSGKQTLYAISRQYNLAPADIKSWNNLKSDQVRAGQVLLLEPAAKAVAPAPKPVVAVTRPAADPGTLETRPPVTLADKKERAAPRTPVKLDSVNMLKVVSQIRESGIAEVIKGTDVNKYLALHHSAPIGSYVTVTNNMNGRSISVRVIGTLPDIGSNEKVIIKLSKKAQQKLLALDQRFLVDVVYTPQ